MQEQTKEKFSLKDDLFNAQKVHQIALEIEEVYVKFETELFEKEVVEKFPKLELKERMYHIRDMFKKYLPQEYVKAVNILLEALPTVLDTTKRDDDFGEFIYAPYSEYVTKYGCCDEHLAFSLNALREMTKRFSVEFSIRNFINEYPVETVEMLRLCATSDNYHERRLASEGLRPKLPWAKKITLDYGEASKLLEYLYYDTTRYVTRSVANHLNDVSKMDAGLVIETLKRWEESRRQDPKEMAFLIRHSLRTLVKKGDEGALKMLGYSKEPNIKVIPLNIKSDVLMVGEALVFEVNIEANEDVNLMVDYLIHFKTKLGTLSKKVHKLKQLTLKKNDSVTLTKKHLFKANMSTRTFYEGEHKLSLQINGEIIEDRIFYLKC